MKASEKNFTLKKNTCNSQKNNMTSHTDFRLLFILFANFDVILILDANSVHSIHAKNIFLQDFASQTFEVQIPQNIGIFIGKYLQILEIFSPKNKDHIISYIFLNIIYLLFFVCKLLGYLDGSNRFLMQILCLLRPTYIRYFFTRFCISNIYDTNSQQNH